MATSPIKQPVTAKSSLTGISATLASANYGVTAVYDSTTNQPPDLTLEVAITPGTVSGNKQAVVFMKESLDNSVWRTGPESGTSATDEGNLLLLGYIPLNTNATLQRGSFDIVAALGFVPPYSKYVVKNDSGAAFSAVTMSISEVGGSVG